MRTRNLVLVIALLVVMPVVLLGCDSKKDEAPAVEGSINGFVDAYCSGDYETCVDYLVGITDANRDTVIGQLSGFHQICPTIEVNSIDNVAVNKSTATADVTLTALGQQATFEMTLNKSDGTWRFSFGDMLAEIQKQLGS